VLAVYNRLRTKYSVKERDTGIWLKPEIERFAGKSKEIVEPNAGTVYRMASSLSSIPHLNDVNLPGLHSSRSSTGRAAKVSRRGARSAEPGTSGINFQLHKGQNPIKTSFIDSRQESRADRQKIMAGAEEFLQMRDEIFARQLHLLKQEGDQRGAVIDSQARGDAAGHYSPMLPAVSGQDPATSTSKRHQPHRFGTASAEALGKDGYRQYDSNRVREGTANQAIADYYDSVQNKLYGMPPIV
jgi:hypothetical protein